MGDAPNRFSFHPSKKGRFSSKLKFAKLKSFRDLKWLVLRRTDLVCNLIPFNCTYMVKHNFNPPHFSRNLCILLRHALHGCVWPAGCPWA
ncbi:AAEL017269-PA [Aedes aegypti]|uniref:AAEL017269-PA n=1 Tax=Aedes aegypti TaxID=7159 RepID=J9HZM3_AEDAE|nr:AAEL017269-PA [Aedes aegypti]